MGSHEYIIIGAGPAGLQMGYFMQQAGCDYIILERNARAGSFFEQQPRHRTLISLNKRYNWFEEPDFNLRYDWNSLLTHDHSMRFPDYTTDLYPQADVFVKYLNDFAEKFALQIRYNTQAVVIRREPDGDGHFTVTTQTGEEMRGRCLLMATGAVKPNVAADIEGIEFAEGYETHDVDPKRFINKRVVILGHGNSAFEVANHISGHAATVQIFTGGKLIRQAWQTHFVGDLRAVNNTFLEMGQVKMPHAVSGARITMIERQGNGSLLVHYDEDVPHWAVPGTMHSVGEYDYVIRATGWKYIDPSVFSPEVRPAVDSRSKYPILNSIWESSVPDLFFIGAAMANNDRTTTPGFIHGFRYNIGAVFHLIARRYQGVPLPSRTFPLTSEADLDALVESVLSRVSTSSALFQMFGVLGEALTIQNGRVTWFSELPVEHVLQQPEFTEGKDLVIITLELGFDRFAKGTDSLTFIHPNDPGGDGFCTAFIHPVLRHFSGGKLASELHLQSGIFVRYDSPNEKFAIEFDKNKPRHLVFNFFTGFAGIATAERTVKSFTGEMIGGFTPWSADRREEDMGLPKCLATDGPKHLPDMAKYQ